MFKATVVVFAVAMSLFMIGVARYSAHYADHHTPHRRLT
jgi:hypothetical protein